MCLNTLKKLTIGTGDGTIFSRVTNKFYEITKFNDKNMAFKSFENNLLTLKGMFFIILLIMAIYYPIKFKTKGGMITKKPGLFVAESIVVGLSSMIPFLMLTLLRNKRYTKPKIMVICLALAILFFGVNFMFESSGFYEFYFPKYYEKEKQKEIKIEYDTSTEKFLHTLDVALRSLFIFIFVITLVMMLFALMFVHDTQINYNIAGINKWIIFAIESILFGVISAVPIYFISKNRDSLNPEKTTEEFGAIAAKFIVVHIALQLSGFYNHLFNEGFKYGKVQQIESKEEIELKEF